MARKRILRFRNNLDYIYGLDIDDFKFDSKIRHHQAATNTINQYVLAQKVITNFMVASRKNSYQSIFAGLHIAHNYLIIAMIIWQ